MKFSDYKYTRPDLEKTKTSTSNLLTRMDNATDKSELKAAISDYLVEVKHIQTMSTLCFIRNSIDTTDTFYEKEMAYWDENNPYFSEINTTFYKKLLDHPLLDEIRDEFPHTYLKIVENQLQVFDPIIIEELQEENKLETAYNKLIASAKIEYDGKVLNLSQMSPYTQSKDRKVRKEASNLVWKFFEDNQNEFDSIYDKMVKLRDKMAKKLGFDTYTQMAYKRMNRLDYDETMVANYRQQILDEVVPINQKLYDRQAKRIGIDQFMAYDVPLEFLDGNATPIGTFDDTIQSAQKMYHDLSPETGEFFDYMIENELLDLVSKPGKQSGGYMTFIFDHGSPFIFSNFNGTSGDVDVLTHEAGHAFNGYLSRDIPFPEVHMSTMEACEIHSMSMEFITWPYMDLFFQESADKYRFAHLADALKFLPYGVLVDHFQHEVYNNPDMTPKERNDLWKQLDQRYRPHLDYSDNEFAQKGTFWYRQGHIFTSPFYYIDYTLAQVVALQFWKRFNIDKDKDAWNDYLAISKVGGTQSFTEMVKIANLISPFEDGCLKSVVGSIDEWLESIDDTKL